MKPERFTFPSGLSISRIVTGLWQIADMEKSGKKLDIVQAAASLKAYAEAGYNTFDMADHYGSAEEIAGKLLTDSPHVDATIMTKWCPEPGPMTRDIVHQGVQERLDRLRSKHIDLLQFHWWSYDHPGYIDA